MTSTDDLIRRIAAEGALPRRYRLGPKLARSALFGLVVAALMSWLALGLRSNLSEALTLPPLTAKMLAMTAIGWAALAAMERLARPGASLLEARVILPAILAGLAVSALGGIARPDTADAADPLACAVSIFVLAIPTLSALLLVLRSGASLRPTATGAAAGTAAAALGALGFALHCPIDHGPSVVTWYGAAMLATTALGALLGPRLLRW